MRRSAVGQGLEEKAELLQGLSVRKAQDLEFRRLETLVDDSRKLDEELRRNMQEVIERQKEDFSQYEQQAAEMRNAEFDKFSASVTSIREEVAELEKELAGMRSLAYENVSEKLKAFEDEFLADLIKRGDGIDQRLVEWQENLDARISRMGEQAETTRRELERSLTEEMRNTLAEQNERIVSELEQLKAETNALEEGIREQLNVADESVSSFRTLLNRGLEEVRKEAEVSIKAEISKNSLETAETVKQYQRDLDGKLRELSDYVQTRNEEISKAIEISRNDLDESQKGLFVRVRELDDTIEDARRRVRELAVETDGRIASVRSSVEDAERHIREAMDQAKLIDRADEIRQDMVRRIEDLKGDIERLDQRRIEVIQLENEFVKIRRLEDDVNAKMTRFISEKRRIETMELDFNRLLSISRAVEEKLTQVTTSDDTLQAVQLQIRNLEEALAAVEEKYQRIERKSLILDNTNDGIDRNFRVLQESEKLSIRIGGELERYAEDMDHIKTSIDKLALESEKARDAADRVDVLENALEEIEERIKSIQRARQLIAEAETRLEELNKTAQIQAKAIDSLVKGKKSSSSVKLDESALTIQKRENIHALIRQGWTDEQIAKAMSVSIGVVQLIREMTPKDI